MSKLLRSLIAAVGLAASALLPQAASAAAVLLDFEGIASGAAVAGFYNQSGNCNPQNGEFGCGITFTNAFGLVPDAFDTQPHSGIVSAVNTGCGAGCVITLTSATGFNNSVSLWHFDSAAIFVDVLDANGDSLLAGGEAGFGGSVGGWVEETLNFGGTATRLTIRSSGGATQGSFQIDDIELDLATGGTNVPEPASFALVALALVGAASALRRRRG